MRIRVKCGKPIDNGIEDLIICGGELELDDTGSIEMRTQVKEYVDQFYEEHCHCKVPGGDYAEEEKEEIAEAKPRI